MCDLKKSWFTIFFSPRQTIKNIIEEDHDYYVLFLAVIGGIGFSLGNYDVNKFVSLESVFYHILLSIVIGIFLGIFRLYFSSTLFYLTGSLFKGHASFDNIKTVYAWSEVPNIIPIITLVLFLTIYLGNPHIGENYSLIENIFFISLLVVMVILHLWSYVVFSAGLKEVQCFSTKKTILYILVSLIIFTFISMIFLFGILEVVDS